MILLVVSDDTARVCRRAVRNAGVESTAADTVPAARTALAERAPRAVVLDADGVEGAVALFRSLRDGEFGTTTVPAVLLFDGAPPADLPTLPLDEVLSVPLPSAALREAIERAESVGAYRDAVSRLYELSREHATGAHGGEALPSTLRAAREEADERLAPLMDRPGAVQSLLCPGLESEE